jgi:large subunit ribosomal protein L17
MRHLNAGRKLGVSPSHRDALLRSLTLALIERDSIRTTVARAKELRWFADRMVTLAKRNNVHARRHMVKLLGTTQTSHPGQNRVRMAIERVFGELVPRFQARPGGYTQILRLDSRRAGDNAEMCLIRYIPGAEGKGDKGAKSKGKAAKAAPGKEGKKKVEAKSAKAPQDKPAKAKKKEKEAAE